MVVSSTTVKPPTCDLTHGMDFRHTFAYPVSGMAFGIQELKQLVLTCKQCRHETLPGYRSSLSNRSGSSSASPASADICLKMSSSAGRIIRWRAGAIWGTPILLIQVCELAAKPNVLGWPLGNPVLVVSLDRSGSVVL